MANTFLDALQQAYNKNVDLEIKPGDADTYNPYEPRNLIVDKLGLPDSWRISEADRKEYLGNLPVAMGAGTAGTVSTTEAMVADKIAKSTAQRLLEAQNTGYGKTVLAKEPVMGLGKVKIKPTWDEMLVNRFKNK